MKKVYFTPGPSQIYPTVPSHLKKAISQDILSLSHRSNEFKNLYAEIVKNLSDLIKIPKNYHVVLMPSGTESMERVVQGVVREKSYHVITGAFGQKFFDIAKGLGKDAMAFTDALTPEIVKKGFDIPDGVELICFTQSDTSNGSQVPLRLMQKTHAMYPDALMAVDTVSSMPVAELSIETFDFIFFSVQKGFGLPAGLGILLVSERGYQRSLELQKGGQLVGTYHSLPVIVGEADKLQTVETPNVLNIFLFNRVLQDMNKKGIVAIRKEAKRKADVLYDFFEKNGDFSLISPPHLRSETVIVAGHKNPDILYKKAEEQGLIIGKGYGVNKGDQIRIANFPAISYTDVQRLIEVLGKQ